jgi:hypothetical protein
MNRYVKPKPVLRIRMFYPETRSGSEHFSFRIPVSDPKICLSRILHETWDATYIFIASYGFRSKVLLNLVLVKKIQIRDLGKNHPGSGSRI